MQYTDMPIKTSYNTEVSTAELNRYSASDIVEFLSELDPRLPVWVMYAGDSRAGIILGWGLVVYPNVKLVGTVKDLIQSYQ